MNRKSLHVAAPGNERYFIELFSGRIKMLNIGYRKVYQTLLERGTTPRIVLDDKKLYKLEKQSI